jgi:hypothetical protein
LAKTTDRHLLQRASGRLKLREGNIDHALIFYERQNTAGAKQSNVILYQHKPDAALKSILSAAVGDKNHCR